jgi:hypothetical protein
MWVTSRATAGAGGHIECVGFGGLLTAALEREHVDPPVWAAGDASVAQRVAQRCVELVADG